jgi:hypothetical protein
MSHLGRPSPALVISIIALVMATVGTGYAAFKLPKNSVGTKQIKKNAITGSKVKNRSLTGKDIKLGSLGTVPSAANAANAARAAVADTLAPTEATHLLGAPGQPAFEGGSSNLPGEAGAQFASGGFYKDPTGTVHLQGTVQVGASGSVPGLVFRLPPGFRPAAGQLLVFNTFCSRFLSKGCAKGEGGELQGYAPIIVGGSGAAPGGQDYSAGVVAPQNSVVSLDGITFRAEG